MIMELMGAACVVYLWRKGRPQKSSGSPASPPPPLINPSRAQKAGILLMSLPPETAGQLFKHFSPPEVQRITQEISRLPAVSPIIREMVVREFLELTRALGAQLQGPDALGAAADLARRCPEEVKTIIAAAWLQ